MTLMLNLPIPTELKRMPGKGRKVFVVGVGMSKVKTRRHTNKTRQHTIRQALYSVWGSGSE
jgi:hypothetical protein